MDDDQESPIAGLDPYMLVGVSSLQQPPPANATPLGLEFRSLQGAAPFTAAAAAAPSAAGNVSGKGTLGSRLGKLEPLRLFTV